MNGGFDECIHISDVDYIVEGEHPELPGMGNIEPTEEDRMIVPLEYVNAAETIAKNENMISINNCITVDHNGQTRSRSDITSDSVIFRLLFHEFSNFINQRNICRQPGNTI